jgi:mannose-P-dolichol utilization defect protein 1
MEVGDWLVASAFGMALILNTILGVQIWIYWGKGGIYDAEDYERAEEGTRNSRKEAVSVYLGGKPGRVNGGGGNGTGTRTNSPSKPTRVRLGTPPQRVRKAE